MTSQNVQVIYLQTLSVFRLIFRQGQNLKPYSHHIFVIHAIKWKKSHVMYEIVNCFFSWSVFGAFLSASQFPHLCETTVFVENTQVCVIIGVTSDLKMLIDIICSRLFVYLRLAKTFLYLDRTRLSRNWIRHCLFSIVLR